MTASTVLTPIIAPPRRDLRSGLLSIALLVLTLATTTWAGASFHGVDLLANPAAFAVGLPYALGLLFILGVHEMGHYVAARRHGLSVSPPYFLPFPFGIGTFGAFVRMRSEPTEARQLFDIAVAGPIAGLVASILVLVVGGPSSHSLVMAGSLGLLLTAFNLLPVGQLDGGHIARAWFGAERARWIARAALIAMIAIGLFAWPPMLLWALVAFAFSQIGGDEEGEARLPRAEFGWARHALGWSAAAVLVVLVPLVALGFGAGGTCPAA